MKSHHTLPLLATLAFSAFAADVRLGWDPSPTDGIENYRLYASTNGIPSTNYIAKIDVGTNLTVRVEDLLPGPRYSFAVTAFKGGVESDWSNILQLEVPQKPDGLRVVVQQSFSLTNWHDVGFFKLIIP